MPVVVHQPDPLHLVGCFKIFRHAVDFRHAGNDRVHHGLCLFIHLTQMLPKLSARLELNVECLLVLLQIRPAHPAVLAEGVAFVCDCHKNTSFV